MSLFSLSNSRLTLEFESEQAHLHFRRFAPIARRSWLSEDFPSPLFSAVIDGQPRDALSLSLRDFRSHPAKNGVQHAVAVFGGAGFEIEHHLTVYDDTALIETWQVVRATGPEAIHISRLDSVSLNIPASDYELLSFSSDWGQEFEPQRQPLKSAVILETRKGRSSKGQHPWFALLSEANGVLAGSVAWSGNWVVRFEPLANGSYRLSGGIHDWEFGKTLAAGESLESAHVILALGNDLNDAAQQFAQVGRRSWYPRNELSQTLPVEWNHWWSYEDADISEAVFRANAAQAAALGVEICTLDAGWFGGAEWYQHRGDWDRVNTERFPSGIRALSDDVHAKGMKFGLWCEIEALGAKARLAEAQLDFPALRDGAPLGYVCFGNPDAQEWAFQTLSRLIRDYACDWIKLDFNLDPEAGCNRADHGHAAGDGLYEHYRGYYRVLERIRATFPNVLLENCSSGGLRIDLGMLRQTHLTFLSDPDYPVHSLQVFWGASLMLAPDACLHWSYSEWHSGKFSQQTFNPRDPALMPHQLDYYTRIAMLGAFGFSQKLTELPEWVAKRLATHFDVYKSHVRRFVREATLYHLTGQPRRDGQGERWCAFQYSLPDEHLLFVFRLPGAEAERSIRLTNLHPERFYRIDGFEDETLAPMQGRDLMIRGLELALPEEGSALLRVY